MKEFFAKVWGGIVKAAKAVGNFFAKLFGKKEEAAEEAVAEEKTEE